MNLLLWGSITVVRITSTTLVPSWRKRSQSLRVSSGMTLTGSLEGYGLSRALTLKSCDILRVLCHSILVIINCIKIFTGYFSFFILASWLLEQSLVETDKAETRKGQNI